MKNFLSVLSVVLITLTSCSKDDNNQSIDKGKLLGEWTIERVTRNGIEDSGDDKCNKGNLIFTDDERSKSVSYEWNETTKMCEKDKGISFFYTVEGNKLTFKSLIVKGDVSVSKILKLSNNELVLERMERGHDEIGKEDTVVVYFTR